VILKVEERKKVEDDRDDDVNTGMKRSLSLDQYRYVDHCQQSIITTTSSSSSSSLSKTAVAADSSGKCSFDPQRNANCNGKIASVTIRRSNRIKLISG
jgi:hypothetical protein